MSSLPNDPAPVQERRQRLNERLRVEWIAEPKGNGIDESGGR
jgi:hypothetical protein